MHLVLSQEVIAAIVTVGLTVAAGVIGYLIREYVTRAKPFVAVLEQHGEALEANKHADVPQSVVDSLEGCPFFLELALSSRLTDINTARRQLGRFSARCPDMLKFLSSFSRAARQSDTPAAQSSLYEIFNDRFADDHLSVLIGSGEVPIPPSDQTLPVVLPCTFEPNYDDGCYSILLAGRTTTVSRNLNKVTLLGKQRLDAFADLLQRLELPKLLTVFAEIERIIQQYRSVATVAFPVLDELLDQNSQWSFKIFAANLGTTPFLLSQKPQLFVRDTTKAEYLELCELVLLEKDAEGKEIRRGSAAPLILRAQSDLTFVVVTANVQADMERGGELRQVFKSGKARCEIRFEADQVGLQRHTVFSSPNIPFKATV